MRERVLNDRLAVIFSDLDGTLLHPRTYSFEKAKTALALVKKKDIPLVLVSSKTRAEVEVWRKKLDNQHPFITENGGGIYIPKDYFPFPISGVLQDAYHVITLGMHYSMVRRRFVELRERLGAAVRGFGDMTIEEIMDLTGLSASDAQLAKQRDYGEPFIFLGKTDERFLQEIEGIGLRWTRGRLFHIMGEHHKGRAVAILCKLYTRLAGAIRTIGIGDGLNDLQFLLAVDRPVLVRKLSGTHEDAIRIPGLLQTRSVGPGGWNEAVMELLQTETSQS